MKYMLLIHDTAATRETLMGEEGAELIATMDAIMSELTASGELVGGEGLADPSQTRTVRMQGGQRVTTDGPFAEAKEHLGGYLMLECESIERATAIAQRWPILESGGIEVRPVMGQSGEEM
jgi:hypothetical protein